jgi:hypothetical protein
MTRWFGLASVGDKTAATVAVGILRQGSRPQFWPKGASAWSWEGGAESARSVAWLAGDEGRWPGPCW